MHAMPDEHKKGFLEELQSLDEGTKQKVLIVATVVIMIVIIYFWLAYFNNIVAGVGQVAAGPAVNAAPATATATATAPASVPSAAAAAGPSIWQQMGGGLAAIGQFFINLAHGVRNVFQTPGQYTVNP